MDRIVLEWVLRVALHSRNAHTKHREDLRRIAHMAVHKLRASEGGSLANLPQARATPQVKHLATL